MLLTVALILSAVAYGAFYAGAPGRQSQAVGPPRLLLGAGTLLTVVALVLSGTATRSAVGPVLVLTVMMAVASAVVMIGPFLLPKAGPRAPRSASTKPPPTPPATRPTNPPPSVDA